MHATHQFFMTERSLYLVVLDCRPLVRFLHDLGIVVNFQDDPRLEDTNVLKPEWVTNGVQQDFEPSRPTSYPKKKWIRETGIMP